MSDRAINELFDADEVREVLRDSFYEAEAPKPRPKRAAKPKPDHYEIICISMYKEDLAALDEKVQSLKARGHRKMSRSALIRIALEKVDLESVPRSY
jgi:hypothetical protein